ncbi:MAG TPA: glycosyltransferase family 2 protein [Lacisediminihabitans sp.]|uniref:glycosyltransferase family 2 protein n=1 Tax=Lacisediminihabitans sp. TaxID=2787631 RepID=UPI002ED994D9
MTRSPSPPPLVGVVTVSFDSREVLCDFADSVQKATTMPFQLVIADNKPVAGSSVADIADAHGADYLALPSNPGYGAAMNRAVSTLPPTVRWVLISNPDVVLGEGSIDLLVRAAESDERIGSVGPAIITPDGNIYPSARRVPSLRTGVGHALFYNLWPNNVWSRAYLSELDVEPRDAGWLSGACLLVNRDAFTRIGGFDEGYFMYFEDVDLGDRFAKAGFRNVYHPQSRVLHTGAHSTGTESERMLREHHRSASRFLSRKYSGVWLWPVRAALKVGLKVRSMIEARHGRLREKA